jgi:hypothetical protein
VQAPVVRRAGAMAAAAAANAQDPPAVVQQEGRAELCPRPKSLHELWTEYMFGIGGRKAAKDYTPVERGRCRHKCYCCRKLVLWDCIKSVMSIVDTHLMLQLKEYTKYMEDITCRLLELSTTSNIASTKHE